MVLTAFSILISAQVGAPFFEGVLKLPAISNVQGKRQSYEIAKHPATVFIYLERNCPNGNRYAPEITRIAQKYGARKVNFFRVYVEPQSSSKAVQRHGKEYGLAIPALMDSKKALAQSLGMRITPEVAVVGKDGTLLYRGRIDDRTIEHGKEKPGFRRDLREALDEILAGKPVSVRHTAATGCIIP